MSYATQADLIDRFGLEELLIVADRGTPPETEIDAAAVAAALADADAEINSYLAARMTTPVSPVPRILNKRACEIARYLLWKDRASDRVRQDYADAIAWLKQVANGTASLGDNAAATAPSSAGAPQASAPARRFSRTTLEGF